MKLNKKFINLIKNGEKKKEYRIEKLNVSFANNNLVNEMEKISNYDQLASAHSAERDYTIFKIDNDFSFMLRKAWSIGTYESATKYIKEIKKTMDDLTLKFVETELLPQLKNKNEKLVFVIYSIYQVKTEKLEIIENDFILKN